MTKVSTYALNAIPGIRPRGSSRFSSHAPPASRPPPSPYPPLPLSPIRFIQPSWPAALATRAAGRGRPIQQQRGFKMRFSHQLGLLPSPPCAVQPKPLKRGNARSPFARLPAEWPPPAPSPLVPPGSAVRFLTRSSHAPCLPRLHASTCAAASDSRSSGGAPHASSLA